MDHPVCKHFQFQTGYCKFGEHFRQQPSKESCSSPNCLSDLCTKRHVKICRYFNSFSTCKFGDSCAFNHDIPHNQSDIQELNNQIAELSVAVNEMSIKITELEGELKTSKETSKISFNYMCDYCGFTSNTNQLFRKQITLNHMHATALQ